MAVEAEVRLQRRMAVLGYLGALALLTLQLGNSDRLPLPPFLVIAAFVGSHIGTGLLLRQWRWLPLPLLLLPVAIAAGVMTENYVLAVFGAVALVPPGLAMLALGIGTGRLLERQARRPVRHRLQTAVGGGLLALMALPLPIALFDKHRTVRVDGSRPIVVDERRGTISGVGLGDPAARVRARFGRTPRWSEHQMTGPLEMDEDASSHGPNALPPGPSQRETFLRYPKFSFWINGTRVWSIEIIERRARTKRGVGVGDSLSLVKDAYPALHCGEGDAGSDEPVPYPFCTGQTGPRTYLYFSADYTLPGMPVTSITVFPRSMG